MSFESTSQYPEFNEPVGRSDTHGAENAVTIISKAEGIPGRCNVVNLLGKSESTINGLKGASKQPRDQAAADSDGKSLKILQSANLSFKHSESTLATSTEMEHSEDSICARYIPRGKATNNTGTAGLKTKPDSAVINKAARKDKNSDTTNAKLTGTNQPSASAVPSQRKK